MKVKSESEVTQSCLTLRNPMDRSLPGSSIHGILQAGVLEWGAIAFSTRFIYVPTNDFSELILKFHQVFHITMNLNTMHSTPNMWQKV